MLHNRRSLPSSPLSYSCPPPIPQPDPGVPLSCVLLNTEIELSILANLFVLAAGATVARGGKVVGAVEGELSAARRVALELA